MKLIKTLFTIFLFSLFASCCSSKHFILQTKDLQQIQTSTEENVVHLNVEHILKVYSLENKKLLLKRSSSTNGTGVALKTFQDMTLILSASHVCLPVLETQIKTLYKDLDLTKHFTEVDSHIIIQTNTGKFFPAYVLMYHKEKDLCVALTTMPIFNEIKIANKIEKHEEVYYQGFPLSFFAGVFVPTFNGTFLGVSKTSMNENAQVFSFPTTYGGSGSPVFNLNGELVGIIHSFVKDFHHYSMSASIEDINLTIKTAERFVIENQIHPDSLQDVP